MVETVRVRGQRGSWNARVIEWAEDLPCVHRHFWSDAADYVEPEPVTGDPAFTPWLALLRQKRRCILTADRIDPSKPLGAGHFMRDGYVAVFEIDDIAHDEHGLRFRFVRPLAKVRRAR